ncbi:MAG: peptide-methionine (S)-S-oxide reductase MsrA [Anaerolineales bacterium]
MTKKQENDQLMPEALEIATLGGGCFWCLEPIFDELTGVKAVKVGYAGGSSADPTYQDVCSGTTGHAEVIQISFDPDLITFGTILEVFFNVHDPTTPNRQGADVGTQYRSAIFYHDEGQRQTAKDVVRQIEADGVWDAPIVTEVTPLSMYYPAEEYHQNYFRNNPNQGYCQAVINPKVTKFRKRYADQLKSS